VWIPGACKAMSELDARDVQGWHSDDHEVRAVKLHRFIRWWYVSVEYFDGCHKYFFRRTYYRHDSYHKIMGG
jgi:hypothetical protein